MVHNDSERWHGLTGDWTWHNIQVTKRVVVVVPRHQLSSYGRRAFCVAGPSVWNSLPDSLWNPIIGGNSFRQSLKTFLFATYWCIQRIRGFTTMRCINQLFTYLLAKSWRDLGLCFDCVTFDRVLYFCYNKQILNYTNPLPLQVACEEYPKNIVKQ